MLRSAWLAGWMVIAWLGSGTLAAGLASDASPSPVRIQAAITLSVSSGRPGTPLTITGSGFPPSEFVALYIDKQVPFLGLPIRADAEGVIRDDTKWPGKEYDSSGAVNPTAPGQHSVCGNTAYQGSNQPIASNACANFMVEAVASPSAAAGGSGGGASLPEILVALAIVVVIVGGTVLWVRRAP